MRPIRNCVLWAALECAREPPLRVGTDDLLTLSAGEGFVNTRRRADGENPCTCIVRHIGQRTGGRIDRPDASWSVEFGTVSQIHKKFKRVGPLTQNDRGLPGPAWRNHGLPRRGRSRSFPGAEQAPLHSAALISPPRVRHRGAPVHRNRGAPMPGPLPQPDRRRRRSPV